MPYIFPQRRLKDKDILDVVELNEDFIPAAELYSGQLNAHNIKENVQPDFRRNNTDETAYYKYAFKSTGGDPQLGAATAGGSLPYTLPLLSTFSGEHQVRNDNSWDVVDSSNLRVSDFTTGISTLWITASAQYFWMGFVAGSATRGGSSGSAITTAAERTNHMWASQGLGNCRLQFAIRIDGRIVESTITGKRYAFEHSIEPIRSEFQRGGGMGFGSGAAAQKFPGPHGTWTEGATGLGPAVLPVRLGCYQEVQPGSHTIELVVRRLPRLDANDDRYDLEDSDIDDDVVLVGTRKLLVVELKRYPTATSVESSIQVPAFETEDAFDNEALQVDRVDTIRTAYNTVKRGALARGALNHYHLKSPVIDANQIARSDPSTSLTAAYPGHGSWKSSTHTAKFSSTSSGIGFYLMRTSSGNFQVGPSSASAFDLTEASIFIVTGNVQVNGLKNATTLGGFGSGSSSTSEGVGTMANFGAIALGFTTASSSANVISEQTITYVNSFNAITFENAPTGSAPTKFADHDKSFDEEVNIPLFHVFTSTELSSLAGGENIATFDIYGSTCSPGGAASTVSSTPRVRMFYRRCNLSVIQLFI